MLSNHDTNRDCLSSKGGMVHTKKKENSLSWFSGRVHEVDSVQDVQCSLRMRCKCSGHTNTISPSIASVFVQTVSNASDQL